MAFTITYETLFDILRKEKSREDLQTLSVSFFEEVRVFLSTKAPSGSSSELVTIEYQNTKKILKELYDRRERKILMLALNKARTESAIIDPSILLPQERELFDTLVTTLKHAKEEILVPLLGVQPTRAPSEPPKESPRAQPQELPKTPSTSPKAQMKSGSGVLKVRFLGTVPKFLGKDMTVFGPYEVGDEAELPEQIANILIKKKRAETL